MNSRINLSDIAARLTAQLPAGTFVGTGYDRDYLAKFPKTYPAAWVGAQRLVKADNGAGNSGTYRQAVTVEIVIRLVVARYADGQINAESAINTLHNEVAAALMQWIPPNGQTPLVWVSATDGAAYESVITCDLVFSTLAWYQWSVP